MFARLFCHNFRLLRFNPLVVFLDEVHETLHGLGFGDVELDRRLADVEIDLVWRTSHVTKIRVRHFAGAVHDAAHDGNLHALEMLRARLDTRGDGLQIEQRPPATRTCDVIRLEAPATSGL